MENQLTPSGGQAVSEAYSSEQTHSHLVLLGLNRTMGESLRPTALVLGLTYAIFAITHRVGLPPSIAPFLSALAAGSSLFFFTLYLALSRGRTPARHAHLLGTLVAGLVLANMLLHLYLTRAAHQTTQIILLVIAVGFIFVNPRWLAGVIAAAVLGWSLAALLSGPSPYWLHFGISLCVAVVISVLVHANRVGTLQRLESLRLQDARRKSELETVLRATEVAQRSLATSMAIGQRITSILELDALLFQVSLLIKERFACHNVMIFLLDEAGEYLLARAGHGEDVKQLVAGGFHCKVGAGGLVEQTALRRRPLRLDQSGPDSNVKPTGELSSTHSEIALPLEMGPTLLGVLDMHSHFPAAFSEDDVPFLQMLADQVAIAINNASLYQSEKSRRALVETLNQIGNALTGTLNLSEVLDRILENLAHIVHYDRAGVMLRSGDVLENAAARGFPPGTENQQVVIRHDDVFEEIYRTHQPLHLPDVTRRAGWENPENLKPARTWLGIPLIHAQEVIGMLSLTREEIDPYREDEITLSATFAGQAAIALQNARLYAEITRFNQELEERVRERTEALRTAYEKLEQLDRSKSDFISVASHELRTPLTVLLGYTQMLLDEPAIRSSELLQQMVSGMYGGTTRLNEIVNSLLDTAKIDSRALELFPSPILISTVIENVSSTLERSLAERNIQLVTGDLRQLPALQADPDGLRKVFYQLLVNAIKYTPDGGIITVEGNFIGSPAELETEGAVEVVICDTGIGIDPSVSELIFQKFFQTGQLALHSTSKTKFKGSGPGLGLAIARGIVNAHGGRIWVESPGYDEVNLPGSKFHVLLPLKQA